MLPLQNLVVFGEDWGAHPSSTQHLIGRLRDRFEVLWVNSVGMRRPRFDQKDLSRLTGKLRAMAARVQPPEKQVHASQIEMDPLAPWCVPWPGSRLCDAVNRRLLSRQIGNRLEPSGNQRPILWTSLPTAEPVVGHLGERAVVYYCGDDFGALAGVDHDAVLRYEKRLVEKSDLILAASERLADRFPPDRTRLLPHGVDFDLFSTPAARPDALPRGRKVAGFYGSFSEWIDVDMLIRAAKTLPDWHFMIVGRVHVNPGELSFLPNVTFEGEQPHSSLPGFVQNWSVSLLPFRDNAQIRACNPLKLREYLAAGSPVVATEFPALEAYRDHVTAVPPGGDLACAIQHADAAPDRRDERAQSVRNESWNSARK